MRLILEDQGDPLEQAETLYVDTFVRVDQDIINSGVLEQRLDRAQAGHFVDEFVNQCL